MSRMARTIGAVVLWLGALIVGVYFTTGADDERANTELPAEFAAPATTIAPATTVPAATVPGTTLPDAGASATTTTRPTTEVQLTDTALVASLDGGRFSLTGVVPDAAAIDGLVGAARIVYGPGIDANLTVVPEVEVAPWFDGAGRAITLLPMIGQGSITLDADGVAVSGTAPNEAMLAAFEEAVSTSLGGIPVTNDVEVTGLGFPRFNARRTPEGLVLTGELASDAAQANIVNGAIAVYGADVVVDQTTVGTDLDTPFWTYTLPGVFQLLSPFPDYEINLENGMTSGSLNSGASFDNDSAELKPETQALLGVALAILTRDPTLGMEIAGHTDSFGDSGYNQQLSEERAQAAADFLIAAGIASERLVAIGYGETRPIASDATSEGRELNRRVEFAFGPLSEILAP